MTRTKSKVLRHTRLNLTEAGDSSSSSSFLFLFLSVTMTIFGAGMLLNGYAPSSTVTTTCTYEFTSISPMSDDGDASCKLQSVLLSRNWIRFPGLNLRIDGGVAAVIPK
ncbi:MAG: hypothetical protein JRN67_01635 [Nitrososphaerota archaeon]|nr:hypothetical protein [Nitrososphaerota archaeon]